MNFLSAGKKQSGRCRELVVSGGSTVENIRHSIVTCALQAEPLLLDWGGEKEALPKSRKTFEVAATMNEWMNPTFSTSQSCFLSSIWFFDCEHPFIDETDCYNWAHYAKRMAIRPGFEIVS